MKKLFLFLVFFFNFHGFAQDSIPLLKLKSQIFSLSPIAKNVSHVNGFVLGVGLYNDRNIVKQKINGFNLEVNPLGLVAPIILFYALDKNFETTNLMAEPSTTLFVVNGINISSGGFTSNTQMNGLNISAITSISRMNGLSISAFATAVHIQNGVLVSGIFNYSSQTNGLSVSLINKSSIVNGIQVGMFNNCDNQLRGLQIGFVNISDKTKGLQLGLLNINKKRMMPFINF